MAVPVSGGDLLAFPDEGLGSNGHHVCGLYQLE